MFDAFFKAHFKVANTYTPLRLSQKHRPTEQPPTSGSRISITWLSGAFLAQQKADPASWDGNRVGG